MEAGSTQSRVATSEAQKVSQAPNAPPTDASSSVAQNPTEGGGDSDLSDFLAALKTTSIDKLTSRQNKAQEDIRYLQKRIYDSEDNYISESLHYGNIVKGWDNFLAITDIKPNTSARRPKVNEKDRIFSSSSVSYPIESEMDGYEDELEDDRDKRKRAMMGLSSGRRRYDDYLD